MKAARLHDARSVDSIRYEDAPDPRPGPGEILVRVRAAGVTPSELLWAPTSVTRSGEPRPLPLVLGHELSGEVAALGPGVTGWDLGDAIYGMNDWFSDGASAELCVAKATEVARKPASIDHLHAAVVPISGLTAWQGLFGRAGLERGQRVLVHGGAGAVGQFAVQLAHWRGAHVTTTVSAHNLPLVRGLGADETIDRRATRFEDVVRDVDVVFDTVGGETLERSWAVVRPGGKVVTVAADAEGERTQAVRDAFFIVEPRADELAELARLIDGGVIRAMVDATFPLSRARDAYRHRPRHGKAVLEINPAALPGA